MKVNDVVPVSIAGQVVAQATVKELADGQATLVVPATLVVMATRTELTYDAPTAAPETETIITGVDRPSDGAVVDNTNTNPDAPAALAPETLNAPAPVDNAALVAPTPTETPVENTSASPVAPTAENNSTES